MPDEVKNKRVQDGVYEFTYKGQTTQIVRRPDLYFDLIVGGNPPMKGYMKDLKAKFASWVDRGCPGPGQADAPAPVEAAAPAPAKAKEKPVPLAQINESLRRVESAEPPARHVGILRKQASTTVANPKRAYAHFFWRLDHKSKSKTHVTGLEVYAKFANGDFDDKYPNVRTAMAEATKENPMDNGHAFFWPDLME